MVQSQYSAPPPNGRSSARLYKAAASLPSQDVKGHRKIVSELNAIITGKNGPRGSCRNKALNCQIFIVGYLQFVEKEHLQVALCSTGYGMLQWQRN